MKVGLFHGGGHTEIGGLIRFLERAFPGVFFERCFPARARTRRAPPGRDPGEPPRTVISAGGSAGVSTALAPRAEDEGMTGADLISRMLHILREHHRDADYDAYLLVDDADCRFCADGTAGLQRQAARWSAQVEDALGRPVPLLVCLAMQEIEAWFLADWMGSFETEYGPRAQLIRRALAQTVVELEGASLEEPEGIGCPQKGRGCTLKLSEQIQGAVAMVPDDFGRSLTYSKAVHGQAMLRRLDPARVAERCPIFRQDLARVSASLGQRRG